MWENGSAAVVKFDIEDTLNRRKTSGNHNLENPCRYNNGKRISGSESCSWKSTALQTLHNKQRSISSKNLESRLPIHAASSIEDCENFRQLIPRKFFLQGSTYRLKSRSDSDFYLSDDYKDAAKYRDFEVLSFTSDSDITVIRVLRKSRVQRIPSQNLEGILGDGSHLPESQSMVNLATLVQSIPASCAEERLMPLSSWDLSINRTASDTSVQSVAHLAAHSYRIYPSTSINDRFLPSQVVAGLSKIINPEYNKTNSNNKLESTDANSALLINADSNEKPTLAGFNKSFEKPIIVNKKFDDHVEFIKDKSSANRCSSGKLLDRISTRFHKTWRRALGCSCFPVVKQHKNRLDSYGKDL